MRLRKMLPALALADCHNRARSNTILVGSNGDGFTCVITAANIVHVGLCKLGVRVIFAASQALGVQDRGMTIAPADAFWVAPCARSLARWVPILGHHIRRIVGGRAEEKVGGIHASRIVTVVTDEQSIGNGAISEFVCHPTGVNGASVEPELSISIGSDTAKRPAIAALVNLRPEAFIHILNLVEVTAALGTIGSYLRHKIGEFLAAHWTGVRSAQGYMNTNPRGVVARQRAEGACLTRASLEGLPAVTADTRNALPWGHLPPCTAH